MKDLQPIGDVSALPSVTFGDRSLMWWGTLGFMAIEGWTMALLFGVYFYLRQHSTAWPPLRTPAPSLRLPTINMLLMLTSLIPTYIASKCAARIDKRGVRVWLVVSSIFCIAIVVLRWWELWALNTRWDTNAYGSVIWIIVGYHASLLVVDVADTLVLTLFFLFKRLPAKALSDVNDNSFYWYFTIGVWIPVYLIVYLAPSVF